MSIHFGLSLSPSFSELCLVDTKHPNRPLAFKRTYLASETLTQSIKKFITDNKDYKISKAFISSNRLEKILQTRLGGNVSQIITRGFSDWPYLRQPLTNQNFDLSPKRTEPLSTQEYIFEISERIDAEGNILTPLNIDELDEIIINLKRLKIEKVCINLLFSRKNPEHSNQIKNKLEENGFIVFSNPENDDLDDEILYWRLNILNSCLFGTFQEISKEITLGLSDILESANIFYVKGDGHFFQNDRNSITASLFGNISLLASHYKKYSQCLYLGAEKWTLLYPKKSSRTWESPWGTISLDHPLYTNLIIQPNYELIVDDLNQLKIGLNNLGYEPGPIHFGKALKPQVFDILKIFIQIEEQIPWLNDNGAKKFLEIISTLIKNKSSHSSDVMTLLKAEFNEIINQIGMQILLSLEEIDKPIICTGLFAQYLFPYLKNTWPELNWELCPYSHEIEGLTTAQSELLKEAPI